MAILAEKSKERSTMFDVVFKKFQITCEFCIGCGHEITDCASFKNLNDYFTKNGLGETWLKYVKDEKRKQRGKLIKQNLYWLRLTRDYRQLKL